MVCGGRSRMRLSLGLAASQVGVLQFSVARSPGSPSNHFLANPPLSSHTFKFPVARSTHGPREQKTVCNLAGRRRASRSSPHLVLPLRELAAIRAKSENYGFTAVGYFIYLSPSLGRLTFQMPDTAQSHSSVVALGKLRSVAAPHE